MAKVPRYEVALNVRIPADLRERLGTECAERKVTLIAAVEQAIEAWLKTPRSTVKIGIGDSPPDAWAHTKTVTVSNKNPEAAQWIRDGGLARAQEMVAARNQAMAMAMARQSPISPDRLEITEAIFDEPEPTPEQRAEEDALLQRAGITREQLESRNPFKKDGGK